MERRASSPGPEVHIRPKDATEHRQDCDRRLRVIHHAHIFSGRTLMPRTAKLRHMSSIDVELHQANELAEQIFAGTIAPHVGRTLLSAAFDLGVDFDFPSAARIKEKSKPPSKAADRSTRSTQR